jgi:protocatechuate 3,4-dioxygenase beta subunit
VKIIAWLLALILVPSAVVGQVGGLPVPPQAPPRDSSVPVSRVGTGRIRGQVVEAATGQPIRRALVRLVSGAIREGQGRAAATDIEGRYEFAGLSAGRYSVSTQKPAFVTVNYGQKRPAEPGKPLDLREGQTVDRIDFALPAGGVMAGRVVDEYGAPVAGAVVQAMVFRFVNGERRLNPTGGTSYTADNGEFRMWGLMPGEYSLVASPLSFGGITDSDDRSGYAPSYYPGTPNIGEAQSVHVAVGETVTTLVITLAPARMARVRGIAFDVSGHLLRAGSVMAMPRVGAAVVGRAGGAIGPDGSFIISNLPPGEWILQASLPPPPAGEQPKVPAAFITVQGDDLDGVVLAPMEPATLSGRIVFDNPAAASALGSSAVRIGFILRDALPMLPIGRARPAQVNDDFTFTLETAPGRAIVRAGATGSGQWSLKAVRHRGVDVTDGGFELLPGQVVDGVEVELTNATQVVSGLVTNDKGEVVTDATVYLFSQDRDRWFPPTRFAATAPVDQNGRYVLRTLPPGNYYAIAVEYLDTNRRSGDVQYLEDLSTEASRFTLRENETKTLDLSLSEPADP